MKLPMKLNRSHLIVSVGSMIFVMILLSVLGYLKFSEGYESPEALEDELKQLMDEMTSSPVVQELVTPPVEEPVTDEAGDMVVEDEEMTMETMAPGPMNGEMEMMAPGPMGM